MTFKRPRLSSRGEKSRGDTRDSLYIRATCQVGDRPAEEAWVTDIAREGCGLRLVTIGVTKTEPVVLCFADEAPITGRLKWIRQGALGLAFDAPLEDEVLARVLAIEPPNNVVPLRSGLPR